MGGRGEGGAGGNIQHFWEGETWHFIEGLDSHLETMSYYLTLKSL